MKLRCGMCGHHFEIVVSSQKSIDNAIANKLVSSVDCSKCYAKVGVEPTTLTCIEMRPGLKNTNLPSLGLGTIIDREVARKQEVGAPAQAWLTNNG